MKDKVLFTIIFLVIIGTWACEEEDDFLFYDPSFTMIFINQSSIDAIQSDTILDLTDSISKLNEEQAILEGFVADTLVNIDALNDSLEKGGLEPDKIQAFQDELNLNKIAREKLLVVVDSLDLTKDSLNSSLSHWNSTIRTIQSGLLEVSSITNNKNGKVKVNEDSLTSWRVPLSSNEQEVDLNLMIDEDTFNVKAFYELRTEVDEKGFVKRVPYNLDLTLDDKFSDFIVKYQTSERKASETTVTVYF